MRGSAIEEACIAFADAPPGVDFFLLLFSSLLRLLRRFIGGGVTPLVDVEGPRRTAGADIVAVLPRRGRRFRWCGAALLDTRQPISAVETGKGKKNDEG